MIYAAIFIHTLPIGHLHGPDPGILRGVGKPAVLHVALRDSPQRHCLGLAENHPIFGE